MSAFNDFFDALSDDLERELESQDADDASSSDARRRAARALGFDSDDDIDDRALSAAGSDDDDSAVPIGVYEADSTIEGSYDFLPGSEGSAPVRDARDASLGSGSYEYASFDFDTKEVKYGVLGRRRILSVWNDTLLGSSEAFALLTGDDDLQLRVGDLQAIESKDIATQSKLAALMQRTEKTRGAVRARMADAIGELQENPAAATAARRQRLFIDCMEIAVRIYVRQPTDVNKSDAAAVLRTVGLEVTRAEYETNAFSEAQQEAIEEFVASAERVVRRERRLARRKESLRDAKAALDKAQTRLAENQERFDNVEDPTALVGPGNDQTETQMFRQLSNIFTRRATDAQEQIATYTRKIASAERQLQRESASFGKMRNEMMRDEATASFLADCKKADTILQKYPQRALKLNAEFVRAERELRRDVLANYADSSLNSGARAPTRVRRRA